MASAAMSVVRALPRETRQAWILSPAQDALLVVAAPLLVLAAAVAAFAFLGAVDATAYILLLHVVLTVAHHLPTFIRVYGDVDLFRRFKWTFVLAPLIPLGFTSAALVYLNTHDYPVENVLYLWVLLALWDPWHFLMQHYGFTRIYDRHNAAPKKLAARMDLVLSATWFAFIMLASGEWLAGILEDLFLTADLPLAVVLPPAAIRAVTMAMLAAATAATLAYGIYLVWCRQQGYFVSYVKLALFVTMFGVMFIAYTPNAWILSWAPGWTFAVGFAVIGVVHMTQYLAIVWRYNRSLAAQPQRARAGMFRALHGRGGWLVGGAYVALCLAYGGVLTTQHENRLLMSVLLALGFTSTLLHYYFDGFIWKLRHRQNRENLGGVNDAGCRSGQRRKLLVERRSIAIAAARTRASGRLLRRAAHDLERGRAVGARKSGRQLRRVHDARPRLVRTGTGAASVGSGSRRARIDGMAAAAREAACRAAADRRTRGVARILALQPLAVPRAPDSDANGPRRGRRRHGASPGERCGRRALARARARARRVDRPFGTRRNETRGRRAGARELAQRARLTHSNESGVKPR